MIKRLIACLTICLIITGLISPVFSDASALPQPNWNDPGISEIINISDLTGWMLNGGTYDVSTYTDAESFMNDYYAGRTSTKLVDGVDLYYNEFGLGQDLYNIGAKNFTNRLDTNRMMASSFREHSGYGRRFSEQANEALLNTGNLYNMKIPLLNEVEFANFVGYNHDALKLYQQYFKNAENDPSPEPDPDYSYISNINNIYVYNYKLSSINTQIYTYQHPDYYTFAKGDYTKQSFIGNNFNSLHVPNQIDPMARETLYCLNGICTINITHNQGNNAYVTYSTTTPYQNGLIPYNYCGFYPSSVNEQNIIYSSNLSNARDITPFNKANFNTLGNALAYIYQHYTNINLYVNAVPWVLVDVPINDPMIPEFPDVVGGEDLPATTWPVHRPLAPYYTSVPGMLKAIDDAIKGDGKLDIDDLKPYLTDENGDPVPDPVFDPEPVPIPVPDPVNPDVVPQLPELPAMPLDMPGFNGVSVLAEIINFTNQSLPNVLIVTFWGIIFGIVILGLIKILHK